MTIMITILIDDHYPALFAQDGYYHQEWFSELIQTTKFSFLVSPMYSRVLKC